MNLKETVQYLFDLGKSEPIAVNVGGLDYTTRQLLPVRLTQPEPVQVHTLTGLVDYLQGNRDRLDSAEIAVFIASPKLVVVGSRLQGGFNQRFTYLRAEPFSDVDCFVFGEYMENEDFIVAMQSLFVQDETTERILALVGNIKDDQVGQFEDDGITQKVTARRGISLSQDAKVPNPVELAPFRTFMEIEQPPSKFVLRMKSGEPLPEIALFLADGGLWKIEAINRIAAWLGERLPEEYNVIS